MPGLPQRDTPALMMNKSCWRGLQAQELTTLKDARRRTPEPASDIRSSLAPQLSRINRGLEVRSETWKTLALVTSQAGDLP